MQKLIESTGILVGSALWLILLIVTNFSVVAIDIGLVGALGVTASSTR